MSSFLMARVGGRGGVRASAQDQDKPVATGEPMPTARTFWLVLLASSGLATSALFALWGLADLIDGVIGQDGTVITLVWLVFLATSVLAIAFVTAAACDLRAAEASARDLMWWERARIWWKGALPAPEPAGAEPAPADAEPAPAPADNEPETAEHERLRRERVGLVVAAVAGGAVLFVIGVLLYSLGSWEWALPTSGASITPIAIIYLAGFTTFGPGSLVVEPG